MSSALSAIRSVIKFSALFIVAFFLYILAVALIFGVESRPYQLKKISAHDLPLTEPRQWPGKESVMLQMPGLPGLKETRDHRYLNDPYFSFRNYKNFHGHLKMSFQDQVIFDKNLNTDEDGRRCIESKCLIQETNCGQIALFLSSKIFGFGVNDDETLSAQIKKEIPTWSSYNYGILTGNYVQFLVMLKSGELKKHLQDIPSVFVFFWEADGFDRTIPTLASAPVLSRSYFSKNPQTGRLDYSGNMVNAYPVRSWLTWNISSLKYFTEHFPNFSFFSEQEKLNDFVQIQKEIQYEIGRQFKSSRYILANIDYGYGDGESKLLKEMNSQLNFPLIEINLSDYIENLKKTGIQTDYQPYDTHPTAIVYAEAARRLKKALTPYINSLVPSDKKENHCSL